MLLPLERTTQCLYEIVTDEADRNNELQPERAVSVTDCWHHVHGSLDPDCSLTSYEDGAAGKFLAVNGGAVANAVVYEQTIAVTRNTNYRLSAMYANAAGTGDITSATARLMFFVNGVRASAATDTAFANEHAWKEMYTTWNSGSNDFATVAKVLLADEQVKLVELDARRKIAVPKVISQSRNRLIQLSQDIALKSKGLLMFQRTLLQNASAGMERLCQTRMSGERKELERLSESLKTLGPLCLSRQNERVGNLEDKIQLLHPDNILRRGFSITRHNGKAVTEASQLTSGDEIVTQVYLTTKR